jgi:hypothetical protein
MSRAPAICVLAIVWLFGISSSAEEKPSTYYVQLIRGSEQEQAPEPGSRRVGPKLAGRFECMFHCHSYWEICQEKVEVLPGRVAHVRLRNDREVQIDLTQPGKRRVSAFRKGRLMDRTVEPAGDDMTLIGGDRDQNSHWFVVVRRDKPGI